MAERVYETPFLPPQGPAGGGGGVGSAATPFQLDKITGGGGRVQYHTQVSLTNAQVLTLFSANANLGVILIPAVLGNVIVPKYMQIVTGGQQPIPAIAAGTINGIAGFNPSVNTAGAVQVAMTPWTNGDGGTALTAEVGGVTFLSNTAGVGNGAILTTTTGGVVFLSSLTGQPGGIPATCANAPLTLAKDTADLAGGAVTNRFVVFIDYELHPLIP